MDTLGLLEKYLNLPATITVDEVAITEVPGEVVVRLADLGFEVTIPLFSVAWLLAMKATDRLYRGVQAQTKPVQAIATTLEAEVETE